MHSDIRLGLHSYIDMATDRAGQGLHSDIRLGFHSNIYKVGFAQWCGYMRGWGLCLFIGADKVGFA